MALLPAPRRGGILSALIVTTLIAAATAFLREELNPDWYGYQMLFEGEGAWLQEQARDPLFLWFMGLLSDVGVTAYDDFRLILGLYFVVFTFALLRGSIIRFDTSRLSFLPLLLGTFPLVALRFTVQIREGLALTLVLLGMAFLQSRRVSPRDGVETARGLTRTLASLAMFTAAYLVHAGTLPLLAMFFAGLYVRFRGSPSSIRRELRRLSLIRYVAVVCGVTAAFAIGSVWEGTEAVSGFYGATAEEELRTSLAKYAYWIGYGAGMAIIVRRLRRVYDGDVLDGNLRTYVGAVGIALLPAAFAGALVLLFIGAPAVVVSAAARIVNTSLSLVLFVVAVNGGLSRAASVFSLFLAVDQVRIIYEAVQTTYAG